MAALNETGTKRLRGRGGTAANPATRTGHQVLSGFPLTIRTLFGQSAEVNTYNNVLRPALSLVALVNRRQAKTLAGKRTVQKGRWLITGHGSPTTSYKSPPPPQHFGRAPACVPHRLCRIDYQQETCILEPLASPEFPRSAETQETATNVQATEVDALRNEVLLWYYEIWTACCQVAGPLQPPSSAGTPGTSRSAAVAHPDSSQGFGAAHRCNHTSWAGCFTSGTAGLRKP